MSARAMFACFLAIAAITAVACGSSEPTETTPPEAPAPSTSEPIDEPPVEPASERPTMTVEECKAVGTVVGDIGDGAVHRPDYRCADGRAPVGRVSSGIEGAVCCPT